MIFTEINGKVLIKPNPPTGDNLNWMLKNGLNPSKYTMTNSPVGEILYLTNQHLYRYTFSVELFKITTETIKEIEKCNIILIYFDDNIQNNIIRVKPIIDLEYRLILREKKLKRILDVHT